MGRQRAVPVVLATGYGDGFPPGTVVGVFLDAVRGGNALDVAAHGAGLNPVEVEHWSSYGSSLLARAEGDVGRVVPPRRRPYAAFALAIARAQAEAEETMLGVIRGAALGDEKDAWRAAAWILARRPTAPVEVTDEADDDDEIQRLAAPVSATVRDGAD